MRSFCSMVSYARVPVTKLFLAALFAVSQPGLSMAAANAVTTRFADPIATGSNSKFFTISNYVDLATESGVIKDYNCGKNSYDGHAGTDFELVDFYSMDEGVAVLCAASGTVYSVVDGASDRNSELRVGDTSNTVVIIHSDNSSASYLHFRKNSIRVKKGQHVKTGDTLGLVGSSGYSTGPHLHFEVSDANDKIIDPFMGSCGSSQSLWKEQFAYNLERKTEVLTHGLTTLAMSRAMVNERPPSRRHFTAGDTIKSWVKIRNIKAQDVLTWVFTMPNGETFSDTYTIAETNSSSWWYSWYCPFQNSSYFGTWRVAILCNDTVIAVDSCVYDTKVNMLPVTESKIYNVKPGGVVTDTLNGHDSDGALFWYNVATPPKNGTFSMHGPRQKFFTYTPREGFSGIDTFIVYCVDDANMAGNSAVMQIRVNTTGVKDGSIKKKWSTTGSHNGRGALKKCAVLYSISGRVIKKVHIDNLYNRFQLQKAVPAGQLIVYHINEDGLSTTGHILKLP